MLLVLSNPLIYLKGRRDLALSDIGGVLVLQLPVICVDLDHIVCQRSLALHDAGGRMAWRHRTPRWHITTDKHYDTM